MYCLPATYADQATHGSTCIHTYTDTYTHTHAAAAADGEQPTTPHQAPPAKGTGGKKKQPKTVTEDDASPAPTAGKKKSQKKSAQQEVVAPAAENAAAKSTAKLYAMESMKVVERRNEWASISKDMRYSSWDMRKVVCYRYVLRLAWYLYACVLRVDVLYIHVNMHICTRWFVIGMCFAVHGVLCVCVLRVICCKYLYMRKMVCYRYVLRHAWCTCTCTFVFVLICYIYM